MEIRQPTSYCSPVIQIERTAPSTTARNSIQLVGFLRSSSLSTLTEPGLVIDILRQVQCTNLFILRQVQRTNLFLPFVHVTKIFSHGFLAPASLSWFFRVLRCSLFFILTRLAVEQYSIYVGEFSLSRTLTDLPVGSSHN